MRFLPALPLSAIVFFVSISPALAQLDLKLPTDNTAIFSNDPSKFYMYTDRHFEGKSSKPWTGGKYGFVRNQKRTSSGIVFTRLHEGVDIRPVRRDKNGSPLDVVRAIMPGTVVYVNNTAAFSSYGKYIVIHHDSGHGPFFSLYAHLMSASAKTGQKVKAGETIGRLGYTGNGINRERSHLHLELTMLMSDRFQKWYDKHFTSRNYHGIYSGFNLTGMDIAGLYLEQKKNPNLTLPEFISKAEVYYKVAVPNRGKLELVRRYPWLLKEEGNGKAWEISFAATGLPVAVRPSNANVKWMAVTWVKDSKTNHEFHTMKRISGVGKKASVTASGSRYFQLLTDGF